MNDNLFQISFYWMNSSRPLSLSVPRSLKSKQGINFVVILSFTNLILHTSPPALQYSYPSWEVVKVLLSEKKKIKELRKLLRCLFWLFLPPRLGWVFVAFYKTQDTNTHRHTPSHTFCTCSCFGSVSVFVSDFTLALEKFCGLEKKLVTTDREREV